jgi:hypothetical protein
MRKARLPFLPALSERGSRESPRLEEGNRGSDVAMLTIEDTRLGRDLFLWLLPPDAHPDHIRLNVPLMFEMLTDGSHASTCPIVLRLFSLDSYSCALFTAMLMQ